MPERQRHVNGQDALYPRPEGRDFTAVSIILDAISSAPNSADTTLCSRIHTCQRSNPRRPLDYLPVLTLTPGEKDYHSTQHRGGNSYWNPLFTLDSTFVASVNLVFRFLRTPSRSCNSVWELPLCPPNRTARQFLTRDRLASLHIRSSRFARCHWTGDTAEIRHDCVVPPSWTEGIP